MREILGHAPSDNLQDFRFQESVFQHQESLSNSGKFSRSDLRESGKKHVMETHSAKFHQIYICWRTVHADP